MNLIYINYIFFMHLVKETEPIQAVMGKPGKLKSYSNPEIS